MFPAFCLSLQFEVADFGRQFAANTLIRELQTGKICPEDLLNPVLCLEWETAICRELQDVLSKSVHNNKVPVFRSVTPERQDRQLFMYCRVYITGSLTIMLNCRLWPRFSACSLRNSNNLTYHKSNSLGNTPAPHTLSQCCTVQLGSSFDSRQGDHCGLPLRAGPVPPHFTSNTAHDILQLVPPIRPTRSSTGMI